MCDTFPSVVSVAVRDIDPSLALYWAFPRALEGGTAGSFALAGTQATRVRVAGWALREGDRLLLRSGVADCKTAPTANRFAMAIDSPHPSYSRTGIIDLPVAYVYSTATEPTVDGAVQLSVCYFPVGMTDAQVPSSLDAALNASFE